jgi:syntaxin 1B/2/3
MPQDCALVVDRMSELRQRSQLIGVSINPIDTQVFSIPAIEVHDDGTVKPDFFTVISTLQSQLQNIKLAIEKIEEMRASLLSATTVKQEQQIRDALNDLISVTNTDLNSTKQLIQTTKEEINQNISLSASDIQTRTNMVNTLGRRFQDHLVSFQKAQSSFADDAKQKAVRQLQVALPSVSNADATKLVEEGVNMEDAISAKMQLHQDQNQANVQVIEALYGLQAKLRDVQRLEQSIQALHQMFVEMAALVSMQGEYLEHIEVSVAKTKDMTKEAEKALVSARKQQFKNEKRMMKLCCCCCVLFACIFLPFWASGKI